MKTSLGAIAISDYHRRRVFLSLAAILEEERYDVSVAKIMYCGLYVTDGQASGLMSRNFSIVKQQASADYIMSAS
jgi:hypothetical protein